MKKIYIAGRLNDKTCIDYIKNCHKMIKIADKIRKLGFTVFIPCYDFLGGLVCGNWDYEDYFQNNQSWIDVSDGVFLIPGWEDSEGTKKEIERAKEQGIPVFDNLKDLIKWK